MCNRLSAICRTLVAVMEFVQSNVLVMAAKGNGDLSAVKISSVQFASRVYDILATKYKDILFERKHAMSSHSSTASKSEYPPETSPTLDSFVVIPFESSHSRAATIKLYFSACQACGLILWRIAAHQASWGANR